MPPLRGGGGGGRVVPWSKHVELSHTNKHDTLKFAYRVTRTFLIEIKGLAWLITSSFPVGSAPRVDTVIRGSYPSNVQNLGGI